MKEGVCCPSPSRAQSTLLHLSLLVTLLSSGSCPPSVIPHLCGATLLASQKKSGGLRPIAIGEVLRRLTSKCLSAHVLPLVKCVLPPHQVGVSTHNGAEALIHSLKLLLSNPSVATQSKCCLLLDFSNAFNSIDRSVLFQEVRSKIPALSPWLECCYGAQPHLLFGDYTILSCSGVQQGDPLGPLAFSLVLHPLVERIQREVPGLLLNGWYLDDGTLCGSPEDLLSALAILEEEGPSRGLHLNHSKSLLFLLTDPSCPLPQDIPTTSEGFVLLGAPIGPPEFCRSVVRERIEKIGDSVKLLSLLEDSQSEYSLLRSCLSLPKLLCALRTTSPDILLPVISEFDSLIFDALSDLVGGALPMWSRLKAALPIRLGGVGLRRACDHAAAIFLASVHSCSSLILNVSGQEVPVSYVASAFPLFSRASGLPDVSSFDSFDFPVSQKALSRAIDQCNFDHLLEDSPDLRSRALLLSTSIPHAGDWLGVLPSSNLGLHFLDCEFRLCLQYWLGVPLAGDFSSCPICSRPADPLGDHALACGGNNDRVLRHNSLRDVIFSAVQSAALSPRREVPSLVPDSLSHPADVYLPHWSHGRPATVDVTVISPLQCHTLSQSPQYRAMPSL